jgi:hypothetical protein
VQTKYDQAAPFVQKIVNSKTKKEQKEAVHGMIEMLAQNARPGAGRGQGLPGAGRGGPSKSGGSHVEGMPVKGKQISPDMIQVVRDEGGYIGHVKNNCNFGSRYKFPHLSDSVLQCIAKEVAARKKSAVALVADGKKDSPKGIAQPQGKGAPTMTAESDGATALNSFLTEFLKESALQNGAAAISERGVRGFGLGFHVMETENLHVFEEEFLDVMTVENLHVLEEEFFDVEGVILDVMEVENLHVIEEESSVPVSASRKPKRVKLMAPLKLIRSGKMSDRSDNHKVTKHMTRKHVRSDGMVLNFDEIVPEEGADVEKGNGKRKAILCVPSHASGTQWVPSSFQSR